MLVLSRFGPRAISANITAVITERRLRDYKTIGDHSSQTVDVNGAPVHFSLSVVWDIATAAVLVKAEIIFNQDNLPDLP
jgi:hypothetical protein